MPFSGGSWNPGGNYEYVKKCGFNIIFVPFLGTNHNFSHWSRNFRDEGWDYCIDLVSLHTLHSPFLCLCEYLWLTDLHFQDHFSVQIICFHFNIWKINLMLINLFCTSNPYTKDVFWWYRWQNVANFSWWG